MSPHSSNNTVYSFHPTFCFYEIIHKVSSEQSWRKGSRVDGSNNVYEQMAPNLQIYYTFSISTGIKR